jgi:hypothetical protein
MEEAQENGKELSHSARANGMNAGNNHVPERCRTFQPGVTSIPCWDGQHPGNTVFSLNSNVCGLERRNLKGS